MQTEMPSRLCLSQDPVATRTKKVSESRQSSVTAPQLTAGPRSRDLVLESACDGTPRCKGEQKNAESTIHNTDWPLTF